MSDLTGKSKFNSVCRLSEFSYLMATSNFVPEALSSTPAFS